MGKIKSMVADFTNGLKIIVSKPEKGKGDRKLAKMSLIVIGQIPMYGKDTVRKQVIKSIENDMKRAYKKGGEPATEKLMQNAFDTPEYMKLLHRLDLSEPHVRVIAMEVGKKYAQRV